MKIKRISHLERNLRRKAIVDYWKNSSHKIEDLEFLCEKYGYCMVYIKRIVNSAKSLKKLKTVKLRYVKNKLRKEIKIAMDLGASFNDIESRFNITKKKVISILERTNKEKELDKAKDERRKNKDDFYKSIFNLWKSGCSATEIARQKTASGQKISKQRIHQILCKYFDMDSVRHGNSDKEDEILRDFANGDSKKELAKKYNETKEYVSKLLRKSGFVDKQIGYKKEEKYNILKKDILDAYEKFKNESDFLLKITCHLKCYASQVTKVLKSYGLYKSGSKADAGKRISISQSATWSSGVRDFWEEVCESSWSSALKRIIAMSTKCKTIARQHAQKNTMLDKLYKLHPDAPDRKDSITKPKKLKIKKIKRSKNERVVSLNKKIIEDWSKDILL